MSEHYDRLENRPSAARESMLFRDLRHVLAIAKPRVPALRGQLKGVDVKALLTRADLVTVPLRRQADILLLQAESPPFGGLSAGRIGALLHAFVGPGATISLGGQAKDWWGMGRALFAAGLRKGSVVLNCFSYDLLPFAHMIESGARAIGCPIIPAGSATLDRKVDAVVRLRPHFFCGEGDHLKELLDRGQDLDADMSCIKHAIVTGFSKAGLRNEFSLRGIAVRHVFAMPEIGPLAYESGATDGLTVNEGLIIEIVVPGTGMPVAPGQSGEIVVTRINADYPLLRYATGFMSAQLPQASTCGRTNMRICTPRDMRPERVDVDGKFVHITHIHQILARHPGLVRLRLVTRRRHDADELVMQIEDGGFGPALNEKLLATLHSVTRIRGAIELVRPGTLSDEDPVLVDERPLT